MPPHSQGASAFEAVVRKVVRSITTLPNTQGWLRCLLVFLVYIVIAFVLGLTTGTLRLQAYSEDPDRLVRFAAIAFFVIALAFAATIAPWMARNHAVFGYYTLGTNLGMNAYVGNHRDAPGGAVADHWPSSPQLSSSNEAEVDRELMRMAIGFVASNPWQALAILPRKLMHLYLLETEATTSLFQGEHPSAAWMKYTLYGASQIVYVAFLVLFCLRVLDLGAHSRRPRGAQWTGWLLIGYFTLLCLVFHGEDRYRLPILPWMLIEGSVLLARASKRDNTR